MLGTQVQFLVWEYSICQRATKPVCHNYWACLPRAHALQQEKPPQREAAAAKSLQSCLTLCDLIDSSPSGSPVPGILQARTLEWGAISFSNACKWKVQVKSLSRVRLLVTPWTTAHQAPPSMGFSRQEYWSGVPLPSPQREAGALQIENSPCNQRSPACSIEDPAQLKIK